MACADVGAANPDISGIGIIVSFAAQGGLSILLALWSYRLTTRNFLKGLFLSLTRIIPFIGRFDFMVSQMNQEGVLRLQRIQPPNVKLAVSIIGEILKSINDIQTLNGIALLIAALAQSSDLTLYHKHIVYDAVSFTGVSFCAALIGLSRNGKTYRRTRLTAIVVFSCLYLAFTIDFGKSLGRWDNDVSGRCYIIKGISDPEDIHPDVDQVYLTITCFYLFICLIMAVWAQTPALLKGPRMLQATDRNMVQTPDKDILKTLNSDILQSINSDIIQAVNTSILHDPLDIYRWKLQFVSSVYIYPGFGREMLQALDRSILQSLNRWILQVLGTLALQVLGRQVLQSFDRDILQALDTRMRQALERHVLQAIGRGQLRALDRDTLRATGRDNVLQVLDRDIFQVLDRDMIQPSDDGISQPFNMDALQPLDREALQALDIDTLQTFGKEVLQALNRYLLQALDGCLLQAHDRRLLQALNECVLQTMERHAQGELEQNLHVIAMLQYPLHLYILITLRASNSNLLSGDSENTWGFGQIVTLVSLGSTIMDCFRGMIKYHTLKTGTSSEAGSDEDLEAEPGNTSRDAIVAREDATAEDDR
ncbi:hypothetical protein PT974_07334 [Cladobotryum mycophilum]|uniref:Uncharacterized protein n=1 Tax=Cladobotryum mycophilum TaxID=491253 RepID=A0ABR0SNY8_9HYPO